MAARTPDHVRLQILGLAASGHSQRQICRRLGVSKSTVQRTLAAAAPPDQPAEPAEVPDQPAPTNARGMLAAVVEGAAELVDRALADGDMGAAQRSVVDLREGAGALRRLEETLEVGGVRMTMREIQAEMAGIYGRARELIAEAGPVHCQACGVALRAALPDAPEMPTVSSAPEPAHADESPAAPRAREAYDRSATVVHAALADGNVRAAQRANRAALGAAKVVARIERDEQAQVSEQTYLFPDALVSEHLARLSQQSAALAAAPLMCPPCLRAQRLLDIGAIQ